MRRAYVPARRPASVKRISRPSRSDKARVDFALQGRDGCRKPPVARPSVARKQPKSIRCARLREKLEAGQQRDTWLARCRIAVLGRLSGANLKREFGAMLKRRIDVRAHFKTLLFEAEPKRSLLNAVKNRRVERFVRNAEVHEAVDAGSLCESVGEFRPARASILAPRRPGRERRRRVNLRRRLRCRRRASPRAFQVSAMSAALQAHLLE